jgi:hypothetical protein
MNTKSRKTIEVESLLDYANGFLRLKFGSQEERRAIILMIEFALMKAKPLSPSLPRRKRVVFIRQAWHPLVSIMTHPCHVDFISLNTDPTRVRYA